ncbi:DUF5990 family protein [Hydrogenophaga sp. ANAO-22]|uniref:DUF5990 family protein n=1 Tax=Hydrogenophaga sp. ANAO-22 TaxID=3166645 RepID=UPI0036D3B9AF
MKNGTNSELQIILAVTAFPPGVRFAVQHGRDDLLPPYASTAELVSFAMTMSLGPTLPDGSFNFRGPFAQGTPADRFIYLNSGTYAGQPDSRWERRAKIKLAGIPQPLVETAAGDANCAIEGRIHGTARDGGPVCATVGPQAISWHLIKRIVPAELL